MITKLAVVGHRESCGKHGLLENKEYVKIYTRMSYIIMKGYVLVVVVLLAAVRMEARPQDETTPASVQEKSGEATEKKGDESKTGEPSPASSTEAAVEEKAAEKSGDPDTGDPKKKRATDDAVQEKSGDSSTESATASPVEGKSGQDSKDSKSGESSEAPKVESKEAIVEKTAEKADESKSGDSEKSGVDERTVTSETAEKAGVDESRSSKDASKHGDVEQKSAEVSTSTEAVHYRSAYGSSSILETKGRSAETEESDSSEMKGRAHVNLRVPPVNPLAVMNDLGSRRMDQPNLMLNLPQPFPPPLHILPNAHPAPFNRYLNAPSVPVPKVPSLAHELRTFDDFRQETNAYPYSPTSSQQAETMPKIPSLRDLPKLPSYPSNFYKPYDQNFSGNYGARPRRYTVPDSVNRYAYNNYGYPHFIR